MKVAFVQQRLVNDTDVEKAFCKSRFLIHFSYDFFSSVFPFHFFFIFIFLSAECGDASFLTFHSDKSGTLDKQLNHHLVQATFLNRQTCTVTIATKGTDEMSLEELQTLQEMIYYVNSGLIVVEIGEKTNLFLLQGSFYA